MVARSDFVRGEAGSDQANHWGGQDVVYLLTNILFLWDFMEGLRAEEELPGRLSTGISIGELNRRMADEFGMKVEDIKRRGKNKVLADARAVVSYFAVRELGYNGAELGKMLHLSRSGVSVAAKRGEELVQSNLQFHNFIT